MCGWLKDRFGLSWQINYAGLADLMTGDPGKAGRVMGAMMQMSKDRRAGAEGRGGGLMRSGFHSV